MQNRYQSTSTMMLGLMVLGMLSGNALVRAETAVHPFPLRAVRLLDGPFLDAQTIDLQYILSHDPNRFLAPYRREAGLPSDVNAYGDWESGGLDGHIGGHYLTALAQMAVITDNAEVQRRLDYMISELAKCQQANGNGYIGGVPNSQALWQQIAAGQP